MLQATKHEKHQLSPSSTGPLPSLWWLLCSCSSSPTDGPRGKGPGTEPPPSTTPQTWEPWMPPAPPEPLLPRTLSQRNPEPWSALKPPSASRTPSPIPHGRTPYLPVVPIARSPGLIECSQWLPDIPREPEATQRSSVGAEMGRCSKHHVPPWP
ncbi:vegetative cell wall protein gp1-like [Melopsittacus undulatus]|uniref:vegetative cell wall protein gp1-like n=1 Tax=Melopsittacus undulatus TaxID=13146 RepID=UPI00146CFB8B|nr:vegetative cell wall protein gp1-like [Melopsittacus undulatus]